MRRRSSLPLPIAIVLVAGCAQYHPQPLDQGAVDAALQPPDLDALRVAAASIEHPILRPIQLDPADGLSPDEAAVLAVLANPDLRAARDKRGVAEAQLVQAGLLPNPQISAGVDVPTGGSTEGTVNGFGLGVDWDISALFTHEPEVEGARAESASVALDVAWQEWQVAEDAKLHAVRVLWLERALALADASETDAQSSVAALTDALDRGLATIFEADAARSALQKFHLTRLETADELEAERLALNRAIGLPSEARPVVRAGAAPIDPALHPPEPPAADPFAARLDLMALRLGYDSEESHVRAAVRSQFPRLSLGVNVARDTGDVVTTGVGISLDLPIFDHAQGRIAIEEATRKQLFDEYMAHLFEARADLAALRAETAGVKRRIAATDEYVSRRRALVESYSAGIGSGTPDVLTLWQARDDLADIRLDALRLRQRHAELLIGLEIATGRPGPSEVP